MNYLLIVLLLWENAGLNVKEALVSFLYGERIKVGLLTAARLVESVNDMSDEDRVGAEKLLLDFLNLLAGEINLAFNATQVSHYGEASRIFRKCVENAKSGKYDEAVRKISEAISATTTGCQEAAEILRMKELL